LQLVLSVLLTVSFSSRINAFGIYVCDILDKCICVVKKEFGRPKKRDRITVTGSTTCYKLRVRTQGNQTLQNP
jgi:dolichol kinase